MAQVLPDLVWLVVNSIGRAALDATVKRGTLQPWVDELSQYVQANGKFSKFSVAYLPISPPPLFWDYKCKKCLWFQLPNACLVVDGDITPSGWCSIWLPPENYKAFTWPTELLKGDW